MHEEVLERDGLHVQPGATSLVAAFAGDSVYNAVSSSISFTVNGTCCGNGVVDAPSWLVEGLTIPATVGEFWMIGYLLLGRFSNLTPTSRS